MQPHTPATADLSTLVEALPDAAADTWPETQFTRARQVEFLHALAGAGRRAALRLGWGIGCRTLDNPDGLSARRDSAGGRARVVFGP